jgi:murein DD-endopeptidase MepM/ murein hydrolase activator NlpD
MYHQGPTYALQVLSAAGPTADLTTLFNACMSNAVLGQYGARYRTARDLIAAADITGITPPPPPPPVVPNGNARYIEQVGDQLAAHFQDGETIFFYRSSGSIYLPRSGDAQPTPVQPPPPVDNGSWTVPLAGPISMVSGYGPRPTPAGTANINGGFHYGADFVPTDGGDPDVVAPCPMIVTVAYRIGDANDLSYGTGGNYVKGHAVDGSYSFVFYHMATGSLVVNVGDTLTRGQKIGVMGGTGNVTGPHLHFETYVGIVNDPWPPPYGNPIDPLPVLRAHGVAV